MFLSKSKYCEIHQCPKTAWLRKHKPEEFISDDNTLMRMENGNEVGDLAMGIFGDYCEVTAYDDTGKNLDLTKMIKATKKELSKGTPVICEASFEYNGLYCAVDILRAQNGGWAIYEVKSSTHVKPVYIADISYQKYVLEKSGINVTGTYLININSSYVFNGKLKLHELFSINDVSKAVAAEIANVPANIAAAEAIIHNETEPELPLTESCRDPYKCGFWQYCTRALPKPCVFDLYRMSSSKKFDYYNNGLISYEDLLSKGNVKNKHQLRQMQFEISKTQEPFVDKKGVEDFLNTLSYPIYFLDFESMQPIIPQFIGTRPYAQITFQYSLHYIEKEGGELMHKEFLAESGTDPRRELALRLCRDIPKDVCVTAYNKSFECGRIKELAETFPDLAEHLMNIHDNIHDLLIPFQSGYYYNRAMGGSYSIKSVLPALFPDEPALDYHNLEGVHNGSEAMSIFPLIAKMPADQREKARNNLLKYCELDTYAMVKVWEKLKESIK